MNKKNPSGHLDVKLIAFDLDDTLLNNKTTITDRTVNAIKACAEKGIYIVLCSGRPENGILPHVRRLDIAGKETGRYMIAINGSSIFDLHTRQALRSVKVEGSLLQEVHHFASGLGLGCHVAKDDTIIADCDTEWTRKDSQLCGMKFTVADDFDKFVADGYEKMLIPAPVEKVQKALPLLKDRFAGKIDFFTSKPFFIEVMPHDVGKGQSLLWLADYLKIDRKQTMAFGDSFNDESMLKMVEHSVCMLNGQEEIKQLSKYVTEASNNDDGIGIFLEKYVL